jgi:hypothetical protein
MPAAIAHKLNEGSNPQGYTDLGNGLALQVGTVGVSAADTVFFCPFGKLYSVTFGYITSAGDPSGAENGDPTLKGVTHNPDGTLSPTTIGKLTVSVEDVENIGGVSVVMIGEARH